MKHFVDGFFYNKSSGDSHEESGFSTEEKPSIAPSKKGFRVWIRDRSFIYLRKPLWCRDHSLNGSSKVPIKVPRLVLRIRSEFIAVLVAEPETFIVILSHIYNDQNLFTMLVVCIDLDIRESERV